MKSHEIPSGVKYILTVKNKMKKCLKRVATYDAYSYLSSTKHCIFRKDAHLTTTNTPAYLISKIVAVSLFFTLG